MSDLTVQNVPFNLSRFIHLTWDLNQLINFIEGVKVSLIIIYFFACSVVCRQRYDNKRTRIIARCPSAQNWQPRRWHCDQDTRVVSCTAADGARRGKRQTQQGACHRDQHVVRPLEGGGSGYAGLAEQHLNVALYSQFVAHWHLFVFVSYFRLHTCRDE